MPKNPSKPKKYGDDSTIIAELDALRRELLGHMHRASDKKKIEEDLVVFRFVYGLSRKKWMELTGRPDLAAWLAMPLRENTYVALQRMQQTLENISHAAGHDDLTGLARRDMFERSLISEMERARRTKSSVSLAILDIDDFKQINDSCGHVQGDAVLRAFAAVLQEGTRETDLCARFGGEEFALIMPATPMVKALPLLERLMTAVRHLDIHCPELNFGIKITCSAGLACYKGLGDLHPGEFIEMADKALYSAKQKGKDRIEKAPFKDIAPDWSDKTLVNSSEKSFFFTKQSNS
ncbi:MAG TPA: GGDEF domain-containing protein [Desulfonatronum sp.]|nr:GGDEF domain-containing protein [Desulfonatronum sp.]